jgi:hypothetical protein
MAWVKKDPLRTEIEKSQREQAKLQAEIEMQKAQQLHQMQMMHAQYQAQAVQANLLQNASHTHNILGCAGAGGGYAQTVAHPGQWIGGQAAGYGQGIGGGGYAPGNQPGIYPNPLSYPQGGVPGYMPVQLPTNPNDGDSITLTWDGNQWVETREIRREQLASQTRAGNGNFSLDEIEEAQRIMEEIHASPA